MMLHTKLHMFASHGHRSIVLSMTLKIERFGPQLDAPPDGKIRVEPYGADASEERNAQEGP